MIEIAIAGAMGLNHSFSIYLDRKSNIGMCFVLFSFDLDFTEMVVTYIKYLSI